MTAEALPEPRDYQAEFIDFADMVNPTGQGMDAVIATQIVDRLAREDPDLLHGWLIQRAESIVREWVGHRARSQRSYEQNRRGARAFHEASLALVDGDNTPMRDILNSLYVGANGRTYLKDMTREDITVAVALHRVNRDANAFEVLFLEAVERRLTPGQTVGAVFTRQELEALRA